jgi:tape measure domain-containing protein
MNKKLPIMAELVFKVQADLQKVIALRKEIDNLKASLSSLDVKTHASEVKMLMTTLNALTREYRELIRGARDAASSINKDLYRSIVNAGSGAATATARIRTLNTQLIQIRQNTRDASTDVTGFVRNLAGISTGAVAMRQFGKAVFDARAEFQRYEVLMQKMTSDKIGGTAMFRELRDFSIISPLTLSNVAKGAQVLLQYGDVTQEVVKHVKQLGDVSLGNADSFDRLSIALGQSIAKGKLQAEEVRQFVNAGWNPLQEIVLLTGKRLKDIQAEMKAGNISSEILLQALDHVTTGTGRFAGVTNEMAKTLSGAYEQLKGQVQIALDDIGRSHESVLKDVLLWSKEMVKNYDDIGRTLLYLVEAYGAYKAGLILATVAEQAHNISVLASAANISRLSAAMRVLNLTMATNPYFLAGVAIAGLSAVLINASLEAKIAAKQLQSFKDAVASTAKEIAKDKEIIESVKDLTRAQLDNNDAYQDLMMRFDPYLSKLAKEKAKVGDLALAYKELNEIIDKRALIAGKNNFTEYGGDKAVQSQTEAYDRLQDRVQQRTWTAGAGSFEPPQNNRTNRSALNKFISDENRILNYTGSLSKEDSAELAEILGVSSKTPARAQTAAVLKTVKLVEDYLKASKKTYDLAKIAAPEGMSPSAFLRAEMPSLTTPSDLSSDTGASTDKDKKKARQKATDYAKEFCNAWYETVEKNLKLLPDGIEKTVALIDLNTNKEIYGLESEIEEIQNRAKEEKRELNALEQQTIEQLQERIRLTGLLAGKEEEAARKKEAEDREKKAADEEKNRQKEQEEQSRAAVKAFRESIDWEEIFSDIANLSTEHLQDLVTKISGFMQNSKDLGKGDIKDLSKSLKQLTSIIKNRNAETNPFSNVVTAAKEMGSARKTAKDLLARDEKAGVGNQPDTIEALDKWQASTNNFVDAINVLEKTIQQLGKIADNIFEGLEGLGVDVDENQKRTVSGTLKVAGGLTSTAKAGASGDLVGIIGGLSEIFAGIGTLVNKDTPAEQIEKENMRQNQLVAAMGRLTDALIINSKAVQNANERLSMIGKVEEQTNKETKASVKAAWTENNRYATGGSRFASFAAQWDAEMAAMFVYRNEFDQIMDFYNANKQEDENGNITIPNSAYKGQPPWLRDFMENNAPSLGSSFKTVLLPPQLSQSDNDGSLPRMMDWIATNVGKFEEDDNLFERLWNNGFWAENAIFGKQIGMDDFIDRLVNKEGYAASLMASDSFKDLPLIFQEAIADAVVLTQKGADKIKQAYEDLYSVSADTFGNSLLDLAKAMRTGSSDAKDLAKNIQKMFVEAYVKQQLDAIIAPYLKDIGETARRDGLGQEAVIAKIIEAANSPEIQALVSILQKSGVLDTVQSGSVGTFQGMSEDVGTELNGRFTAVQESNEDIRIMSHLIFERVDAILENMVNTYLILQAVKEDTGKISVNTNRLAAIEKHLEEMNQKL